jgi:opacity protein-like surface antigen
MINSKFISRTILFIAFIFLCSASYAQKYAFTPFAGGRSSATLEEADSDINISLKETSSAGFLLSLMKEGRDDEYDFLFSRQNTYLRLVSSPGSSIKLRIDYFHLGGTVNYDLDDLYPFITGGIGATHIVPDNNNISSETKFSLSIGGGLKIPLNDTFGLRLEIRWYGTATGGGSSVLCNDGGCVVHFKGNLFWQAEALAGISIAF